MREKLQVGARVGGYQIVRLLGEGGMGFVYEATHEVLNRRSAIKVLRPELAGNASVVARFLQEAKAVNLIDHQNIVNVYDYGDGADGSVYFVMEFLDGETLDDLMRKRRPMAMPLFLHVFGQVCKALVAAHAKRVVHRDLKPANIFVTARENNPYFIKVLDFGIAQLRGEGAIAGLTVAGSVMGTPQYMSPEQVTGRPVDARSDVWALGVMLYRAATGVAPFRGDGFAALADKILHDTPAKASEHVPSIAPSLDTLIASCLERKAEDRCQSVAELVEGLERVKRDCGLDDDAIARALEQDQGATGDSPAPTTAPTRGSLVESRPVYQGVVPTQSRSKIKLAIGAGAAAVALAAGGYFAIGRSPSAPAAAATTTIATTPAPPPTAALAIGEPALRAAIASGDLQLQGQAVDALALVAIPKGAPLLYAALKGGPELRVKAARALAALKLPDAAPKVRAALDDSGDRVRVELAASLTTLGDKDALAIIKRAASDPAMRLVAAAALADAGDASDARPVLTEIFDSTPEGREQWRRAAGGLLAIGDDRGRLALEAELSQHDPARVVAAAEILVAHGDPKAHDLLARIAADPDHASRGAAALVLARLG
ncbi:MAG TPA: protein kinase, partial [Kofleriaceae bacterium]|nr:protein kinase [Kofleriaceae bacterium]